MYAGQKTVFPDIDFCRYQDTEWGKSVNFQQVLKVSPDPLHENSQ